LLFLKELNVRKRGIFLKQRRNNSLSVHMDRLRPKEFVSDIASARNYNLNQNNSHAEITKHFRSARCNP